MAQVSKTSLEAAIAVAKTDGGVEKNIVVKLDQDAGWHTTVAEAAYLVVHIGPGRWVTLKSNGAGTWTEI